MVTITENQKLAIERGLEIHGLTADQLIDSIRLIKTMRQPKYDAFQLPDGVPPKERLPIEELDLGIRIYNNLRRVNVTYVDELTRCTPSLLMSIRFFGTKDVEEVINRLESFGFHLVDDPEWPPSF